MSAINLEQKLAAPGDKDGWTGAHEAIRDDLFQHGERIEAIIEDGSVCQLFFGWLTTDDTDSYEGYYDDDGEEFLNWQIKGVRKLPAIEPATSTHQGRPEENRS